MVKKPSELSIVNERNIAIMAEQIKDFKESNNKEHAEIKETLKTIDCKLDNALTSKVDKDDFVFWRNLLISGIITSLFLMVIGIILKK